MASKFLGSEKHITLLEADCTLMGIHRSGKPDHAAAAEKQPRNKVDTSKYAKTTKLMLTEGFIGSLIDDEKSALDSLLESEDTGEAMAENELNMDDTIENSRDESNEIDNAFDKTDMDKQIQKYLIHKVC